jgi:YggT family protein
MLNPFIELISNILTLFMWVVIIWAIFSTLISFKIINAYQPIVQRLMYALNRLVEPTLRPIRRYLPDLGGIDISPIILILLINFTNSALFTYLYNL